MDEMRMQREAHKSGTTTYRSPEKQARKDANVMEVDLTKKKTSKDQRCFRCNQTGHIIQNCLEKESIEGLKSKWIFKWKGYVRL
jgi:hypothetical protein